MLRMQRVEQLGKQRLGISKQEAMLKHNLITHLQGCITRCMVQDTCAWCMVQDTAALGIVHQRKYRCVQPAARELCNNRFFPTGPEKVQVCLYLGGSNILHALHTCSNLFSLHGPDTVIHMYLLAAGWMGGIAVRITRYEQHLHRIVQVIERCEKHCEHLHI